MAQQHSNGNGNGGGRRGSKQLGVAVLLTAATAAAIGAYFLYGSKKAPEHRQKVKSWMLRAKGDILEQLEHAKIMTEEEYRELVDSAAERYGSLKHGTKQEVKHFRNEMHSYWPEIAAAAKSTAKAAGRAAAQAIAADIAEKVAKRSLKQSSARRRSADEEEGDEEDAERT